MERIKNLNLYQKSILILMLVMALLFAVLYPMTISKAGYEFKNSVLVPHQENGNTVYSGKLKGEQATFTVTEDKTVDPETVAEQLDDIIKKSNFTDIWRECSKNLSKDKDSIDFQTFKDVFSCGAFIEYVVDYEIKVDDLKNMNILKKLDVLLSEIAYNSELLGTYTKGKHK